MDTKGAVYILANRGMYGLPYSDLLANKLLLKRINKHGYQQIKIVSNWQPIQFTLVLDDLGVK